MKKRGKLHGNPHKMLRHVPIIPRIQMLFHFKELAVVGMTRLTRSESRVIRIPIDSIEMNYIEDRWPKKVKDEVQIL